VIAHSAAIQISQCTYICSAMNGTIRPLAVRNHRAVRSIPGPVSARAAASVARLMKL